MAQIHIKVKSSKELWKSPDGSRTIWALVVDVGGKEATIRTYSKVIATDGWEGDVETYTKEGRDGTETFAKQVPKEGGYGGGRQPRDDAAIRAQFAIKAAIELCKGVNIHDDETEVLIESWATKLYAMIDRVKGSDTQPTQPAQTDTVYEVTDDPIDLSAVQGIFGDSK